MGMGRRDAPVSGSSCLRVWWAGPTGTTVETHDQLFEYFVDKIFIGRDQIVIASYYHDSAQPIEFEDLHEALRSGDRSGEVRTYARKQEFDTSPSGGDGGNRTPVRRQCNRTSPGAVRWRFSQPRRLTRTRTPTGSVD